MNLCKLDICTQPHPRSGVQKKGGGGGETDRHFRGSSDKEQPYFSRHEQVAEETLLVQLLFQVCFRHISGMFHLFDLVSAFTADTLKLARRVGGGHASIFPIRAEAARCVGVDRRGRQGVAPSKQ